MPGDPPFNTLRHLGNGLALATIASLVVVGVACAAGAETASGASPDPAVDSEAVAPPAPRRGRIELRRQNIDRGNAEASTKTTLRLETALDGAVSRLRLDLPFTDEKADFQGDPFQPRLCDVKLRAYFRPSTSVATRHVPDIELTFPSADPASLGGGKYQISAALHPVPDQPDVTLGDGRHQIRYEWAVRQTVSVADHAGRKDINPT